MIVGTKNINLEELAEHVTVSGTLDAYCMSLVPKYLQHWPEIIMNQKYLVALHIRLLESIPYSVRKEQSEALLDGVHITGIPTQLVDMDDIVCLANVDNLIRYIEENKQ